LQCNFCGKYQDQVTKLIAGPGVYICNECVDLCQEILGEERDDAKPTWPSEATPDVTNEALSPDMSAESLDQFLKDIGRVRLLTSQEEVDLAKRIEGGELNAKQTIVRSNLRVVVSIAKDYRHQGLPFLDVIRAGTLGLIGAAEKFDYRKGFRFSSYASPLIRQSIVRALPGPNG